MDGDLSWPDGLFPFKIAFYLRPHTSRATSPLTNASKVYGLSAPLWVARLTFRAGYNLSRISDGDGFGPTLDALIEQMEGGANRIAIWDFRRPAPLRPISQRAALTNVGSVAGDMVIPIAGFAPGSMALGVGDYVGGDQRVHRVLTPTFADAQGIAHVATNTPVATAIVAGSPAVLTKVPGWFRLTSDDAGANESEVGQPAEVTLEFLEDCWW